MWLDSPSDISCASLLLNKIKHKNYNNVTIDSIKIEGKKIFETNTNLIIDQKRKKVVSHFQNKYNIIWPTEDDITDIIFYDKDNVIVNIPKKK